MPMFALVFIFISKFQTGTETYTLEFLSLLILGIKFFDNNTTADFFFVNNYRICTIYRHRGSVYNFIGLDALH
jgi:hypothetical protein